MSKTALRAAEVVSLRWSSAIELPEGDQAFQVRTKGGKIHIVLPGPEALAAMRAYSVLAAPNSDHVFHSLPNRAGAGSRTVLSTRGLQKIVAGWQVKTGTGRSVHPHALRHTAIQKAFDLAGGMAAQKLAGHSSALVTSRFYTRPYYDASAILSW
ncbi:MAG: tyrosine-type recombinase/integrase [Spirochaetales bacterium]|nr:tyrosine-type recombinase/integrase [Spirochaetales bacterium]